MSNLTFTNPSHDLGHAKVTFFSRDLAKVIVWVRFLFDLSSYWNVQVQSKPFILEETSVYYLNVQW